MTVYSRGHQARKCDISIDHAAGAGRKVMQITDPQLTTLLAEKLFRYEKSSDEMPIGSRSPLTLKHLL
jgi:hypothetical protein